MVVQCEPIDSAQAESIYNQVKVKVICALVLLSATYGKMVFSLNQKLSQSVLHVMIRKKSENNR